MTTFITENSLDNICSKLGDFLQDNEFCNEKIHKKLTFLSFFDYEKILNIIAGQSSIKKLNPSYSIYKINVFSGNCEHEVDLKSNIGNQYYTTIQADENYLFLNCLNVTDLMMFLLENTNDLNRYVFIPVIFSTEIHETAHISILVFDVVNKLVYFADPNGKTSFFDNMLIKYAEKNKEEWMTEEIFKELYENSFIDSEQHIESLMEFYINKLNMSFNLNYKFVKRVTYNKNGNTINQKYNKDILIGSGHCMIISIMIANYLSSNSNIEEIFELFGKLSIEEKVQLISSYSVGIHNVISQT